MRYFAINYLYKGKFGQGRGNATLENKSQEFCLVEIIRFIEKEYDCEKVTIDMIFEITEKDYLYSVNYGKEE